MPRPYKQQPGHDNPVKAYELRQAGKMPMEIAAILGLSARTVSTYIARVRLQGGTKGARRGPKYSTEAPHCPACDLRMYTGVCENCPPTSAVYYMRSGCEAAGPLLLRG